MRRPGGLKERLSRRQFLRFSAAAAGAGGLAAAAAASRGHVALAEGTGATGAPGANAPAMLVDLTRCVGCGNCQRSCIEANDLHPTAGQMAALSTQTFTYLQKVDLPGGDARFVKRQCMHCVDAACASACPSSAMWKTPEGPIAWRGERCLGCRYCMVSCPFGVPRFEWQNGLTPQIRKCMFCVERQKAGQQPACSTNCPSGALKFGTRSELLDAAHGRIAAHPDIYVNHVYGEFEAGGTGWLYVSDVPFDQLGFRVAVTKEPIPSYTWNIMEKLPPVVGTLAVVLTGASIFTRRRNGGQHDEPEWLHEEK